MFNFGLAVLYTGYASRRLSHCCSTSLSTTKYVQPRVRLKIGSHMFEREKKRARKYNYVTYFFLITRLPITIWLYLLIVLHFKKYKCDLVWKRIGEPSYIGWYIAYKFFSNKNIWKKWWIYIDEMDAGISLTKDWTIKHIFS